MYIVIILVYWTIGTFPMRELVINSIVVRWWGPARSFILGTSEASPSYRSPKYCTVLYCTVLYCTVLYGNVRYGTVRYGTVLHCTALYLHGGLWSLLQLGADLLVRGLLLKPSKYCKSARQKNLIWISRWTNWPKILTLIRYTNIIQQVLWIHFI